MSDTGRMMQCLLVLSAVSTIMVGVTRGDTLAYWRFDGDGYAADQKLTHQQDDVLDSSGSGNPLRTWDGNTAPYYRSDVPSATVTQSGAANGLSTDYDGNDDLYTDAPCPLRSYSFTAWTAEASFNLDRTDRWQVILGKDGKPTAHADPPFLLKFRDADDLFEVGVIDGSGTPRYARTLGTLSAGQWYHVAAVCDGSWLRLYLDRLDGKGYVSQGAVTVSGAWYNHTAGWTVGRGSWNGGFTDNAYGLIDEVRVSNAALAADRFLFASRQNAYTDTVAYWRFEEGTAGNPVPASSTGGDAAYHDTVLDSSGLFNHMRTWDTGAAPDYSNDVPSATIPQTGEANTISLDFTPNQNIYPLQKNINIPGSANNLTNAFTVECSIKLKDVAGYQTFVGKDWVSGNNGAFMLQKRGDNHRFQVIMYDTTDTQHFFQSSYTAVAGVWYHLAVVCGSDSVQMYVKQQGDADWTRVDDGTWAPTGGLTSTADGDNNAWTIGRGRWGGSNVDFINALVDEVRISEAALPMASFLFSERPTGGTVFKLR